LPFAIFLFLLFWCFVRCFKETDALAMIPSPLVVRVGALAIEEENSQPDATAFISPDFQYFVFSSAM
jgi:hypothetical protein